MLHSEFGKRVRSASQSSTPQPSDNISAKFDRDNNPFLDSSDIYAPSKSFSSSYSLSSSISPTKRKVKETQYSDRFIPSREGVDIANGFSLINDPNLTPRSKRKMSGDGADAQREEAGRLYTGVLRSEIFGDFTADVVRPATPGTPQTPKKNLFTYSNSTPTAKRLYTATIDSTNSEAYSLSPARLDSQKLLMSPRKPPRNISKVPFKVLDAPELMDDFYLNLVDWSSSNVLGVGLSKSVYLWSACTSKVTKLCELPVGDSITSVNWMQKGTHVAIGTHKGNVEIWDAVKLKKIRTMTGHELRVGTLAWNEHTLSSGSRDRTILHRDVRSREPFNMKLTGHRQEVCGLKWNSEGTQLASGGNDNKLFIWQKGYDTPQFRFTDHTAAVKAIVWAPSHHGVLASGGGTVDKKIRFWNSLDGRLMNTIDTGSQVCNLVWSKTSDEFVSTHGYAQPTATPSNQVIVWKYPSMQQIATLTGHTYRVLFLAMSPDGQTIVTGAGDETLRFWNVFSKTAPQKRQESVLSSDNVKFR